MTNDTVLVRHGGEMRELRATTYSTESVLQELLASHSALLAGAQIDPDEPRRWLLVSRELGVPGEADGALRWSLDHLFLDQDAIPTLVEVKRSTDSRIRREVIGQMLDYAANGVAYWPVEWIRTRFETGCSQRGEVADEVLANFLEDKMSAADFWSRVKTNLQAGRVRLLFVADRIPAELARVIEFLNQQMEQTEVLGIEIRKFGGDDIETYIPRLYGQTEQARQQKSGSRPTGRVWTEQEVLEHLGQRRGPIAVAVVQRIVAWARSQGAEVGYGRGSTAGSIVFTFRVGEISYYPLALYSYGRFEVQFQNLRDKPPFDELELRQEFATQLNGIPGVSIGAQSLDRRPSIEFELLQSEAAFNAFERAMGWFLGRIEWRTALPPV